ncbi:MAG: hypothetical protein M3522_13620 [Actinomycetota bacterium]|nr:hypothetical protein [Actinomycetota bacterium]
MATTLERRVTQLEATTDGGDRCPGCGNGPDDDKRPYEVVYVDPDDVRPDEWCETCGRPIAITIHMHW